VLCRLCVFLCVFCFLYILFFFFYFFFYFFFFFFFSSRRRHTRSYGDWSSDVCSSDLLVAASLALVVLPALLAVLGPRVNALAPKRLQRAADRDARPAQSGAWYRLSRFVMRRPGWIAALSASFLIALAIPFAGIRFITV